MEKLILNHKTKGNFEITVYPTAEEAGEKYLKISDRKYVALGDEIHEKATPLYVDSGERKEFFLSEKQIAIVEGKYEWLIPGTYNFIAPVTGEYTFEVAGGGGKSGWAGTVAGAGSLKYKTQVIAKETSIDIIVGNGAITMFYDGTITGFSREWQGESGKISEITFKTTQKITALGGGGSGYRESMMGKIFIYNGTSSGNGQGASGGIDGGNGSNGWVKISWKGTP